MLKRTFDIAVVTLSAPIWLPVLLGVATLVRFKLGAPVFFRQERPGLHGRLFNLIKFRTMTNERDKTGALLSDAERLPKFGKWLRSTSLDELPELLVILKGDMSLVGPRPLLVEYLALYNEFQARRHEVRPGLTGWAQVNGRNAITWDERFRLDVWYVDHRSLWLDMKILVLTLVKVLRKEGISAANEATIAPFSGNKTKIN